MGWFLTEYGHYLDTRIYEISYIKIIKIEKRKLKKIKKYRHQIDTNRIGIC